MALMGNRGRHNGCIRYIIGTGSAGGLIDAYSYGAGSASHFPPSGWRRNMHCGEATDDLLSVPAGATHPVAWVLPQKAGAMSSHNETQGEATGAMNLAAGRNMAATSDGASTADATLQLIASIIASAAGLSTADANLLAALLMEGSAAGTSTAAGQKNALAWVAGQADGEATATLTSYATGRLYGEVTPFTELSPEGLANAVWNSLLSQYTGDGTAGKALGLASSGGVDYDALWASMPASLKESLAEYVRQAALADPFSANIKQVNDVTVGGTGASGNEWGPA